MNDGRHLTFYTGPPCPGYSNQSISQSCCRISTVQLNSPHFSIIYFVRLIPTSILFHFYQHFQAYQRSTSHFSVAFVCPMNQGFSLFSITYAWSFNMVLPLQYSFCLSYKLRSSRFSIAFACPKNQDAPTSV